MHSRAKTVQEYLKELPADRRETIGAVRGVILANLPQGYEECMSYGMIGYVVPQSIYPKGYQCNPKLPLPFINLGSQKNHVSLHLCTREGTLIVQSQIPEKPFPSSRMTSGNSWNGNYLAFSLDHGETWSNVVRMTSGESTTHYMAIEETPTNNKIFVTYDRGGWGKGMCDVVGRYLVATRKQ